ncbi:hypothetical protein L3Y34_018826 [Caenorhabditis briggsae]|uniref:Arrestin C-terminal-like domain-containing protein n=1 Tax=Caenorhabditis briggsae TaxID=6238 RepID=A0AAE9DLA4_CAEBR|nr:hypothetical protein L3Y34_018826 [Caenorhabditis briggsae]
MPEPELLVEFDQPQEVFLPGNPISGRVILMTTENYKARAVHLKLDGRAHTNWHEYETERHTDGNGNTENRQKKVDYSATVKYLEIKILIWASFDGSNCLIPGTYAWPFSYRLPSNIPPSFEGKYGYIRYSVTAEVDRPWRFDKTSKRCITVSPMLDLNFIPNAMTPLQDQASENLGCCCFKKGYLSVKLDVPKTGFVPGETVPINLHIVNKSSVNVTMVTATIIQRCTFMAYRNGTAFNFTEISGVTRGEVKLNSNTVITQTQPLTVEPGNSHNLALELRLPSVTPTINQFSPVITVEYYVDVSYLPPSYYQPNPTLPTPSPIGNGVAPPPDYPSSPNSPPYPEVSYPVKIDGVVQPSAPPPSYQDSMYGTDGTHIHTEEHKKPFVPKYPVFHNLPVYNPSAPPQE